MQKDFRATFGMSLVGRQSHRRLASPNAPDRASDLAAIMRISFFTHYTELYGANRSLLDLIDGLAPKGVRAHVICPHPGDLLDELVRRRIPAAALPFEWWVSLHRTRRGCAERSEKNAGHLAPIVAQLVRWRTDVVYSNSSVIDIGSAAAARLGRPHVWHVREFGAKDYDLVPDRGVRAFRRAILSADAAVFVSHALKRHFVGAATPPRTHVIYNGVAREATFDERRRRAEALRRRRQPFTFALVGRFRASKGQAIAIRAFANVAHGFPARGCSWSATPAAPESSNTSTIVARWPSGWKWRTRSSSGDTSPIRNAPSWLPTRC